MDKKVIRILKWSLEYGDYFKYLSLPNVQVKNADEFDTNIDLNKQEDFDKIYRLFSADIIILTNTTRQRLSITIPDFVYVISYCDGFIHSFNIIGKEFFNLLSEKDYLYVPVTNIEKLDIDNVLDIEDVRNRVIIEPFIPMKEIQIPNNSYDDIKNLSCDISIVHRRKKIEYYYWFLNMKGDSEIVSELKLLINSLVKEVKKEIMVREEYITDNVWAEKLVVKKFDSTGIWKYIKNKDKTLHLWKRLILWVIVQQEFANCIIEWLACSDYNFKLWGPGWKEDKAFLKCAMGEVHEESDELYRVYLNSKININPDTMAIHRRIFEAIQLGSLCMQADTINEYRMADYRPFFKDDESIVSFRNKKEMFSNIDFYLSHETKRKCIIKKSQEIVSKLSWNQESIVNDVFDKMIRDIQKRNCK